jgi:hypothetical protein
MEKFKHGGKWYVELDPSVKPDEILCIGETSKDGQTELLPVPVIFKYDQSYAWQDMIVEGSGPQRTPTLKYHRTNHEKPWFLDGWPVVKHVAIRCTAPQTVTYRQLAMLLQKGYMYKYAGEVRLSLPSMPENALDNMSPSSVLVSKIEKTEWVNPVEVL